MPRTSTTVDTRNSKILQIPPAISYKLSDDHFLSLGWTKKPKTFAEISGVTMKAKFSHSAISPWFRPRDGDAAGTYPDGRKLYWARADGSGEIYYPTGKVAVRIRRGGRDHHRTRLWVYGSGEVDGDGVRRPAQLCALFDSLGNGVVYDVRANKRLVYNQEEGVLCDTPSGVPYCWKWHNFRYRGSTSAMNDDDAESSLLEAPREAEGRASSEVRPLDGKDVCGSTPLPDSSSSAAASGSYVNTGKLLPKDVTPLKPIVLRLNSYLSLRIWNQSEICLSFFAKCAHTRLQIGVLYNPSDKLKVVKMEDASALRERVLCPFEDFPVETKSMLRLKNILENIRSSRSFD